MNIKKLTKLEGVKKGVRRISVMTDPRLSCSSIPKRNREAARCQSLLLCCQRQLLVQPKESRLRYVRCGPVREVLVR